MINGVSGARQTRRRLVINLHLGARTPEAGKTKLFFANPWAIDFTNQKRHRRRPTSFPPAPTCWSR